MEKYRKIMYIEKINYNLPDKASTKSLSVCLDNKKGHLRSREYFFCDNINNKINRNLITQHGIKESALLKIINKQKLKGVVGCLVVEADKTAEKALDNNLNSDYGIEKIVLG